MAGLKVIVFFGSYRPERQGIKLVNYIMKKLKDTGHEVNLFDAMKMPFQLLTKPIHFYRDGETPPEWLVEADQKIKETDAIVFVSGEYNFSPQPGLLNMIDHFYPSYRYKVAGLASYSAGTFAGLHAQSALLDKMSVIQTIIVPKKFSVGQIMQAFGEDGEPKPDRKEKIESDLSKFITDLDWLTNAVKSAGGTPS